MRDVLFTRNLDSRFIVERLPDGSAAIFDTASEAVHALNPAAVIAWDRCAEPARADDIAHVFADAGLMTTDDVAFETLERLAAIGIVTRAGTAATAPLPASRRTALKAAAIGSAALALPIVLTLTGAEQKAYAQGAGSGTTTAAPTTSTTSTTQLPSSDRNIKENFGAVEGADVLARLMSVPVETWNYTADDPSIRHIGPMAQDFAAAFAVGADDRHIHVVDMGGVAFASIQALCRRVELLEQQLRRLRERTTSDA
jgi:hypothetical protein